MNTQVEYSILCYCYSDLKPLMIRFPVFADTVDDTVLSRHLGRPGCPALPGTVRLRVRLRKLCLPT